MAALLLPAGSGATAIAPAQVTEFPLGVFEVEARAITVGPDGNLWFAGATRGGTPTLPAYAHYIDRITPDGTITKFPTGPETGGVSGITATNEGLWFSESYPGDIGLIAVDGSFPRRLAVGREPYGIASDAAGNIWFTQTGTRNGGTIGRLSPNGEVAEFTIPTPACCSDEAITAGPGGDMWFTERFGEKIGRITSTGRITEFDLPAGTGSVKGLAADTRGDIWFASSTRVGRIGVDGALRAFALPPHVGFAAEPIAGPDGRIWFTDGPGTILRVTRDGRFSRVALPARGSGPTSLAVGPEGAVWYSGDVKRTCKGGGASCQLQGPSTSLIGRVRPGPLAVRAVGTSAHASLRSITLHVSCGGGAPTDTCDGRVALSAGRRAGSGRRMVVLGTRPFTLPADTTKKLPVRLTPQGRRFAAGHSRFELDAGTTLAGGPSATRRLTVGP